MAGRERRLRGAGFVLMSVDEREMGQCMGSYGEDEDDREWSG